MCTDSIWPSNVGPSYHGVLSEKVTTLSPSSALMGMNFTSLNRFSFGKNASMPSRISRKRSSLQSTKSILFTANTMCGMPSKAEM